MQLLTKNICLLLILVSNLCAAQSFTTRVSAKTIGKDDILEIQYVAEDVSLDQFILPSYKNFTIISGPNLSSSTMQTGNVVKQQTIYSVLVQPVVSGSLTVPGASALINNKPQRSQAVEITVKSTPHIPGGNPPAARGNALSSLFDQYPFEDQVPANQYLKKGESPLDKIKDNIFVKVESSKKQCYVGEPLLVTYKLCTRLRSKSKVVKQPAFTGCTVIELTDNDQDQHLESINGVDYNVFVIRKVQLIPLEEGQLMLPGLSVENTVTFYTTGHTNYRDLFYNNPPAEADEQTVTLENKPLTVEVKSLPAMATVGNQNFNGAIGNFEVSISAGKGLVSNTTNQLYVTIQGEGNLQQGKAPEIQWPKGIDAFEPTETDESDKTSFPVTARKVYSFPFVAQQKGDFTIPPVSFTFFDPRENKYVTHTSQPLHLLIAQGQKTIISIPQKVTANSDFHFRLAILLTSAFIAIAFGVIWRSRRQKAVVPVPAVAAVPEQQVERDAAEYLYNIRMLQPELDSSYFYKLLCKNLQGYLQAKFSVEADEIDTFALQHPSKQQPLQQIRTLLNNCNVGMYTPVYSMEEAMQHRLKAIELLCDLEGGEATRNNRRDDHHA